MCAERLVPRRRYVLVMEENYQMVEQRAASNPLGRITETRDIANMAAFLSSDQSNYLAGLALTVSGGDVMF